MSVHLIALTVGQMGYLTPVLGLLAIVVLGKKLKRREGIDKGYYDVHA